MIKGSGHQSHQSLRGGHLFRQKTIVAKVTETLDMLGMQHSNHFFIFESTIFNALLMTSTLNGQQFKDNILPLS